MIAEIVACRTELDIPYTVSCRALGVSESWFYKHKARPGPTVSERRRADLDAAVLEVFDDSGGTDGSPRIHDALLGRPGFERLSVNTVAGSMARQGLAARPKKRGRSLTRPDKGVVPFPNRLQRKFDVDAPNVAWVGDITEIVCWEGKLYLATVIDLYSRRLIGFAIDTNCKAPLVCDALKMAIAARGGTTDGVVFHSDRGSQYTSHVFTGLCERNRIVQSMSRAGSCLDNAVAESWFSSLKIEMVYRTVLDTIPDARRHLIAWIDRYNNRRRHSYNNYQTPTAAEQAFTTPEQLHSKEQAA